MSIQRGDTFLIPSGPPHDPSRKHLFVVVTKVSKNEKDELSVALVPFCSVKNNYPLDPTCVLKQGEHPTIKHDSFVFYEKAEIKSCKAIEEGISQMFFVPKGSMPELALTKIAQGISRSPKTPQRVKDFCIFAL